MENKAFKNVSGKAKLSLVPDLGPLSLEETEMIMKRIDQINASLEILDPSYDSDLVDELVSEIERLVLILEKG